MAALNSDVVVSAFTQDHVERLTGLSKTQLSYWDRTGFFAPTFAADNRRTAYSRIYSFRDIVCLQVLKTLRNDMGVSLPHLREVKDKLAHLGQDMWSKTTLYVVKKRVVFSDPETQKPIEIVSGQFVLEIPLKIVRDQIEVAVENLWQRRPEDLGQISKSRRVSHNSPVVAGTRVSVKSIKEFAEAGYSVEEIISEYPSLTAADVRAALGHRNAA